MNDNLLKAFFRGLIEFIQDYPGFIIQFWNDGLVGKFFALLFAAIGVLVIGSIAYGLVYLLETAFVPWRQAVGKVIKKKFTPQSTETIYIDGAPMDSTSGPDYELLIRVGNEVAWTSVNEEFFMAASVGRQVTVDAAHGRLSGKLLIKHVYG